MHSEVCYTLPPLLISAVSSEIAGSCYPILTSAFDSESLFITPVTYVKIFLITCALELPIYLWFLSGLSQTVSLKNQALRTIIINLTTHPLVTFAFASFAASQGWSLRHYILESEFVAVLLEWIFVANLWGVSLKRAGLASALANLISWHVGLFLWSF